MSSHGFGSSNDFGSSNSFGSNSFGSSSGFGSLINGFLNFHPPVVTPPPPPPPSAASDLAIKIATRVCNALLIPSLVRICLAGVPHPISA
jgi:hypothetical protein